MIANRLVPAEMNGQAEGGGKIDPQLPFGRFVGPVFRCRRQGHLNLPSVVSAR